MRQLAPHACCKLLCPVCLLSPCNRISSLVFSPARELTTAAFFWLSTGCVVAQSSFAFDVLAASSLSVWVPCAVLVTVFFAAPHNVLTGALLCRAVVLPWDLSTACGTYLCPSTNGLSLGLGFRFVRPAANTQGCQTSELPSTPVVSAEDGQTCTRHRSRPHGVGACVWSVAAATKDCCAHVGLHGRWPCVWDKYVPVPVPATCDVRHRTDPLAPASSTRQIQHNPRHTWLLPRWRQRQQ